MKTEHITAAEYIQKYARNERKIRAMAQTHIQGRMNGTEAKFADVLKEDPSVALFRFESIKLRLADNTFYTPDFMVVNAGGLVAFYEVKGFWRDDARVKIKVAAELYPEFKFVAVQLKQGKWQYEYF